MVSKIISVMKKLFIFLVSFGISSLLFSQKEFKKCTDEKFAVNSYTNITGHSSAIRTVDLPENTIGYIYRIRISKIKEKINGNALFNELAKYTADEISIGVSLANFIINQNDAEDIDAYIFPNINESNNFYNNQAYRVCQNLEGIKGCCNSSNLCTSNRKIYFGFRNTNIREGLYVSLEVTAIIEKPKFVNNSSNNKKTEKSSGVQILEALLANSNNNQNNATESKTEAVSIKSKKSKWQSDYCLENIDLMNPFINYCIQSDSSKLKSSRSSINALKQCIIEQITENVSCSHYSKKKTNRNEIIKTYYDQCAPKFYYYSSKNEINANDYGSVGWNYFLKGEYDKCIEFSNKALEFYPAVFVIYNISLSYLMKGMDTDAMDNYIKAIQIMRNSEEPISSKRRNLREAINDIFREKEKKEIKGSDDAISLLSKELKEYN